MPSVQIELISLLSGLSKSVDNCYPEVLNILFINVNRNISNLQVCDIQKGLIILFTNLKYYIIKPFFKMDELVEYNTKGTNTSIYYFAPMSLN